MMAAEKTARVVFLRALMASTLRLARLSFASPHELGRRPASEPPSLRISNAFSALIETRDGSRGEANGRAVRREA